MSDNATANIPFDDPANTIDHRAERDARDEIVLRVNRAAWLIAGVAFAFGILVGLVID